MKIRITLSNELEVYDLDHGSVRIPPNTVIEVSFNQESLNKLFTWMLSNPSGSQIIIQATTEYCGYVYVIDIMVTDSSGPSQSHIVINEQPTVPCLPPKNDLFVIGNPPKVNHHHPVQRFLYLDGFRGDENDLVGSGT